MANEIQVDAWGAFVPGRGNLVSTLKSGVIEEVRKRNLEKLEISQGPLMLKGGLLEKLFQPKESRDYIIFSQDLGKFAKAILGLRIAVRGSLDLELSWRLFEGNFVMRTVQNAGDLLLILLGFCIFGGGVITVTFGIGAIGIIIGVYMMMKGYGRLQKSSDTSTLSPEQKLDVRILAQTIDYCLMSQLEKNGISSDEIRILQTAHIEGIGRLDQEFS